MNRNHSKPTRVLGSMAAGLALLAGASYTAAATPGTDVEAGAAGSAAPASVVETVLASSSTTVAPTWSTLYRKYMAKDTVGDCGSCHAEAGTAQRAYDWLARQQYMAGSPPYLVDSRSSCFTWLGGDMPPDGPSSYGRAQRDFQAWADAGAGKN
jgi:hypothetical protein